MYTVFIVMGRDMHIIPIMGIGTARFLVKHLRVSSSSKIRVWYNVGRRFVEF